MLRIEAYAVMDGLTVNVVAIPIRRNPAGMEYPGARVTRTIPVETIEGLGIDQALRDVITDVFVLYPGMLPLALE